ncbi:hypothetical protein ACFWBR_42255 [Streptomyces sp. NPDC060006]|uniref:hypothetical protein n=1 Tax=unclassified Streptomyces TaxID=2593676 RepID=UPI0036CFB2D7
MKITTYWKAVVAGVVAGSGALSTAAADGSVTSGELWIIVGAVVGGLGLTWAVPNRQGDDRPRLP